MTFDEALDSNKDPISLLESIDAETATEDDLRRLVAHMKNQMRTRYAYLVGEWMGARRAKNTWNGHFASTEEVMEYLG